MNVASVAENGPRDQVPVPGFVRLVNEALVAVIPASLISNCLMEFVKKRCFLDAP